MSKLKTFYGENKTFVRLLVGCLLLLALFVGVATLSGAWPGSEASAQILSALAGAVVAAIITLFLLLGQTSSEEKKERNTKVFEERLRIYKEFLQKLCDVVKDMKINPAEEIELEFQVAYIAMHTSTESIDTISEKVKEIIVNIKEGKDGSNEMLRPLFEIADRFYKELYGKDNDVNDDIRNNTISNFSYIMLTKDKIEQAKTEQKNDINTSLSGKKLTPKMKTTLLMAKINVEGFNQWIWRDTNLVHELYTDIKNGEYIKTRNMIAVDLIREGDKYLILVFTRQNKEDSTRKLAEEIWGKFNPWEKNSTRHLYKEIPQTTSEDEIASVMTELLNRLKTYRDTKFPLQ